MTLLVFEFPVVIFAICNIWPRL